MITGSWSDRPTIIVGGGSSLKGFDLACLRDLDAYVLGVNWAMIDAPCCTGMTVDDKFIDKATLERLLALNIELIFAVPYRGLPKSVINITRSWHNGLSDDPGTLHSGGTSGYAAINVAYLRRTKKIILLGFDYDKIGAHYHTHEQHPVTLQLCWASWATGYDSMLPQLQKAGIEVINANPNSVITCFPRMTHEEALNGVGTKTASASRLEKITS